MMKKNSHIILALSVVILLIIMGSLWYRSRYNHEDAQLSTSPVLEKIASSSTPTREQISVSPTVQTSSSFGLTVAPGFSLSILAKGVPGARVIAEDELGNLWISQTERGTITRLEMNNGEVVKQEIVVKGLAKPHGLAFDPADRTMLYIATEKALLRYRVYVQGSQPEKILDLPSGGRHVTRTLLFGHDGFLYISIGSTCDVCQEKDSRVAGISRVNVHEKRLVISSYATGLRNAVFMTENPVTHDIVATEMGRDYLGDASPPDEINTIKQGGNYGWPRCYGANIHDISFDDQPVDPCREPFALPSFIDLPAHSAPLGLAYIPAAWNGAWEGNLLVALHGSWNSTQPKGYKVVRLNIDPEGRYYGSEDVITGWLSTNEVWGRPVDIMVDQNKEQLYISDDKAGLIYVVRPNFPS